MVLLTIWVHYVDRAESGQTWIVAPDVHKCHYQTYCTYRFFAERYSAHHVVCQSNRMVMTIDIYICRPVYNSLTAQLGAGQSIGCYWKLSYTADSFMIYLDA
jgi:hypothetical protein